MINLSKKAVAALLVATFLSGCGSKSENFGEGFSDGWSEGEIEVIWTAQAGSIQKGHSIARAQDEICVTNRNGQVRFFELASGQMRMGTELNEAVAASGPCTKGSVAVVTDDARLLFTDLFDGSRSWSKPLNGYPLGSLVHTSGSVISAHPNGEMVAFSLLTGDELWRLELPQSQFRFDGSFRPQIDGELLILGTPEGSLVAIDIIDGFIAWDSRLYVSRAPDPTANLSLVAGPSVFNGVACASAFNGNTACFDSQSGQEIWLRELSSASALATDGKAIFLTDNNGALMALSAANGEDLWRTTRASSSRSPLIVYSKGRIVLDNGFSGISVHDSATGELLGGARLRGKVLDIAKLEGNGIAVLTEQGDLHRLELP